MNKLFSPQPIWQQEGLFVLRLITGFFMIYHGWEIFSADKMNVYVEWKTFKNASGKATVYAGKGAELLGGILLFVGLFTRIASVIVMAIMACISFFVGHGKIWYEDQHPFLFVLLAAVFFFTGPTKYSLDAVLFNKAVRSNKY